MGYSPECARFALTPIPSRPFDTGLRRLLRTRQEVGEGAFRGSPGYDDYKNNELAHQHLSGVY
jgi:hypothetical protein